MMTNLTNSHVLEITPFLLYVPSLFFVLGEEAFFRVLR